MLIAVIGTRFSGKTIIEEYLVSRKGFTSVRIDPDGVTNDITQPLLHAELPSNSTVMMKYKPPDVVDYPSTSLSGTSSSTTVRVNPSQLCFPSASKLLEYVTCNWRDNFVTVDLNTRDLIETFTKRPFFMLLSVDAPLLERFKRSQSSSASLEDFLRENDAMVYGLGSQVPDNSMPASSLHDLSDLVHVNVLNSCKTISSFYSHLDSLNLLHPNRLRPQWDAYFMTLASLASQRSNCMKRRVGAILVRENRIVATGYNGTARGLINCNEGGCARCNGRMLPGEALYECICLHAEENALLEAGRERVGAGAVMYCNTCPCLKCTVKIIQAGVKQVVYNLTYKVDDASAKLFEQAGVGLRRYNPNGRVPLPKTDANQDDVLTTSLHDIRISNN